MAEVKDGLITAEGGMDSSRPPEAIAINQVASATNVTFRGGYPMQRPGFTKITLNFDTAASKANWAAGGGIAQEISHYDPSQTGSGSFLVASIGGRIYRIAINDSVGSVSDITPLNAPNDPTIAQAYMIQADRWLVIQDGQNAPIIYDGVVTRRASSSEVPTGTWMAFGVGRLVVGNGATFQVGDIQGGPTPVISFTETNYLAGGGSFSLPLDMGPITGMAFNARQDTSTGQGLLLVFGLNGVVSVDLLVPRTSWQTTNIQNVVLNNVGCRAGKSIALINGDVFFRAKDGIRSLRDARAQEQGWGKTPQSREIIEILRYDTPFLVPFVAGVGFDNRYLMTVNPVYDRGMAYGRGMIAFDFAPVANNQYKAPPCYDGLWTGVNPVCFAKGDFRGKERLFCLCDHGETQLWEITATDDNIDFDNGCRITSSIETRGFNFQKPFDAKNLTNSLIWATGVQGRVDYNLAWKPDNYPDFLPWQTWSKCVVNKTCQLMAGCSPPNLKAAGYARYRVGQPPDLCDASNIKSARLFYTTQARLTWTGPSTILRFLLLAEDGAFVPFDNCPNEC